MPNQALIKKYAQLTVVKGANVQPHQVVVIRGTTETKELIREITEQAYLAGAKRVFVQWSDDYVSRSGLDHMDIDTLQDVPEWIVEQTKYYLDQGACFISITSPISGINAGIDPNKSQKAGIALMKKLGFYQTHMMANKSQWTVVAAANSVWGKKLFPELDHDAATEKLWDAIFAACRVTLDNDPVQVWDDHNETLSKHNQILNEIQFESLHFKNSLGTDVTVKLVENHVWAGGSETSQSGTKFNPNIPTEETFTMPYKLGTEGKVVATKPLDYQGKLIEDFWLQFKEGKVVDYGAAKEEQALKSLIEFDDGSPYIGEIALISHDSPISNTGILFLNTLFDENASCHMALGRAYPMNVQGGVNMSQEALAEVGANHSMTHVDFMFGSEDMEIIGTTKDGKQITLFKNGNFVI